MQLEIHTALNSDRKYIVINYVNVVSTRVTTEYFYRTLDEGKNHT